MYPRCGWGLISGPSPIRVDRSADCLAPSPRPAATDGDGRHDVTIAHQSPQVDDRVDRSDDVRGRRPRGLVTLSVLTNASALLYATYRGYYAFGGIAGMIGVPRSWSEFRHLNVVAVGVLLVAAIVPLAALPLWRRRGPRRALLALCWAVAVGCVMHALIDDVQRVVSLAGGPAARRSPSRPHNGCRSIGTPPMFKTWRSTRCSSSSKGCCGRHSPRSAWAARDRAARDRAARDRAERDRAARAWAARAWVAAAGGGLRAPLWRSRR
jgi:hypothetical protein